MDGAIQPARVRITEWGEPESWVEVGVEPGETVTVSAPSTEEGLGREEG
jgi:hypothetical protein